MRPLAIDLYCGLGGWTEGLLAEGFDVVGFDNERHVYGEHRYPAQLVIQDVLTLHGSQFRDAALIVASPPCQEYSYMAMPWSRAKAKAAAIRADTTGKMLADLNRLFDACFRIQAQASLAAGRHIPMIVENVKGAQPWVGRARWSFGSFYLWGDVPALMPIPFLAVKVGMGSWRHPDDSRHVPGLGFNTHADRNLRALEGVKQRGSGALWFDKALDDRRREATAIKNGGKGQNPDGRKGGSATWLEGNTTNPLRQGHSRSTARQAASAMIAKIPLPLSRHIAATFRPHLGIATPPQARPA
jgi:hypothetical protein